VDRLTAWRTFASTAVWIKPTTASSKRAREDPNL
jgi:hypothetical protein